MKDFNNYNNICIDEKQFIKKNNDYILIDIFL